MAPLMPKTANRALMIYLKTLKVAMEDGVVSTDEMAILDILSNCIGLSKSAKRYAEEIIAGVERSPITDDQEEEWSNRHVGDPSCYQAALIAALDDDVITSDEMAMLDYLRQAMALQPNEHALVEEALRAMLENQGDEDMMARLESYLTTYPGA